MADEKFGIEKLKEAGAILFSAVNNADAELADGFQTADLIAIAMAIIPLPGVLKSKDEIANEWKDLSDEEIIALSVSFNSGLNLKNKEVQNKIQKTVSAIAANIVAIRLWLAKPVTPEAPAPEVTPTA
jgi:hypothetical protein